MTDAMDDEPMSSGHIVGVDQSRPTDESMCSDHTHFRDAPKYSGHTENGVITAEQSAVPSVIDTSIELMTEHTSRHSRRTAWIDTMGDGPMYSGHTVGVDRDQQR